ncbi:hypothetical protein BYT27DRAFT_7334295 [Phlegmacium glaucopus]|nr:hypothetical protein BYT27DRAFT_7334295 [Phlegmacium glaucopus]
MPWEKSNHNDADCFSRLPISFLNRWQQKSLPLHHTEQRYPPLPQTGPSTSQGVLNYPITPMDDTRISSLPNSSVPTRAEDSRSRDPQSPPGLCKEISNLVAITSSGFERYGRDFKSEKFYYDSFPIRPLLMTFTELHNYLFPSLCPLPSSAISEIKDVLIHAVGNSLTSSRGLAPYSSEDLQKMLDLVNTIEAQDEPAAGSIAIISRFLQSFHHERFLQLHGQINARLNRDQSIHPERQRGFLARVVMLFYTFFGIMRYLKKLRKITVDGLVNDFMWKNLLGQLTADWREFTLYARLYYLPIISSTYYIYRFNVQATVLLNVNVAFLAIPGVDTGGAHIASYISIVTSIGAILLGLLLVKIHDTSLDVTFIVNRCSSIYKLEMLALVYSLPYSLFLYAVYLFLVAFSFAVGREIVLLWFKLAFWPFFVLIAPMFIFVFTLR